MVSPAGMPTSIMIYTEQGNGVLVTCLGSGREDYPPVIEGSTENVAILGASQRDVKNTDPLAREKIEELIHKTFGKQVVHYTMQTIVRIAETHGFPLA